jgi:hypothetical protein
LLPGLKAAAKINSCCQVRFLLPGATAAAMRYGWRQARQLPPRYDSWRQDATAVAKHDMCLVGRPCLLLFVRISFSPIPVTAFFIIKEHLFLYFATFSEGKL